MSWNPLCRLGWPRTHRDPLGTGIIAVLLAEDRNSYHTCVPASSSQFVFRPFAPTVTHPMLSSCPKSRSSNNPFLRMARQRLWPLGSLFHSVALSKSFLTLQKVQIPIPLQNLIVHVQNRSQHPVQALFHLEFWRFQIILSKRSSSSSTQGVEASAFLTVRPAWATE